MRLLTAFLFVSVVFSASCAAPISSQKAFAEISDETRIQIGKSVHWQRGGTEDALVEKRISELLSKAISVEEAVEISLLKNHQLQATYEMLGQAYADVIGASTIRNPVLTLLARFPIALGVTNGEINFLQDIADALMMPLRKSLAQQEFEQKKLQVTHRIIEIAFDTRAAFIKVQAAQLMVEVRKKMLEEVKADSELSELREKAGGMDGVDVALGRSTYAETGLDLVRDELDLARKREDLIRLLSLRGDRATVRITTLIPALPDAEQPVHDLENLAMLSRLDLAACAAEEHLLERALDITRKTWWIASISVGAATSRDAEGTHVAGPTLTLELPLFNRRRPQILRLESQLRAAHHRREELSDRISSEVRLAQQELVLRRAIVAPYVSQIIPLRQRIFELSKKESGRGKLDAYELFLAKEAEMRARRGAVAALRDYWLARTELDRVVNRPLTRTLAGAMQ